MSREIITREIYFRLSEIIGSKKNVDIAKMLGVLPNVTSNWRLRNSVPYAELFRICEEKRIYLHWMLTGEGDKYYRETEEKDEKNKMRDKLETIVVVLSDAVDDYLKDNAELSRANKALEAEVAELRRVKRRR